MKVYEKNKEGKIVWKIVDAKVVTDEEGKKVLKTK